MMSSVKTQKNLRYPSYTFHSLYLERPPLIFFGEGPLKFQLFRKYMNIFFKTFIYITLFSCKLKMRYNDLPHSRQQRMLFFPFTSKDGNICMVDFIGGRPIHAWFIYGRQDDMQRPPKSNPDSRLILYLCIESSITALFAALISSIARPDQNTSRKFLSALENANKVLRTNQ